MNRNYILCTEKSLNRELLGSTTLLTFFPLKMNFNIVQSVRKP